MSQKVKNSAARLVAVQAVLPMISGRHEAKDLVPQYLTYYAGMDVDGTSLVEPDPTLFQSIVEGVEAHKEELEQEILGVLSDKSKRFSRQTEPLMMAVVLCGAYEIKYSYNIDIPIIISDYLNVTHAFFEQNEVKLVNAVLDKIALNIKSPA